VAQRTTLTLEDDVASRLRKEAKRTGKSFKDLVNETLRRGLQEKEKEAREPYRVRARPLKLRPGFDLDNIEGLIERLEGPLHR
jgi:plasmid stability protein